MTQFLLVKLQRREQASNFIFDFMALHYRYGIFCDFLLFTDTHEYVNHSQKENHTGNRSKNYVPLYGVFPQLSAIISIYLLHQKYQIRYNV
jgi:hypothetical protein